MKSFSPFFAGAMAALIFIFGLGCFTPASSSSDKDLAHAVKAGPKLANAAAQEQRRELAKPAPSTPLLSELTEVIIASTETAGVRENEVIRKLVTKVLSLKDVLIEAEKAKAAGDAALLEAQKESALQKERADKAEDALSAANRRPLYWIAGIVGGVLILGGAAVIAGGAQLGIPAASAKGGSLVGVGAFALGLMVVVDRIADRAGILVLVGGGGLVLVLLIALGYGLYRWMVQGKTLAVAVAETDKLLATSEPAAVAAFQASAGRAMDKAHKEVVNLARKAGTIGKEVAEAVAGSV